MSYGIIKNDQVYVNLCRNVLLNSLRLPGPYPKWPKMCRVGR